MFETFDHTADIGIRIRTETLDQLFEEAAIALFSLICSNWEDCRATQETDVRIECSSGENDDLLYDWLCELLFQFDANHFIPRKFVIFRDDDGLTAKVSGELIDHKRHQFDMDVKAITYHGLEVHHNQDDNCWTAQVIVDL